MSRKPDKKIIHVPDDELIESEIFDEDGDIPDDDTYIPQTPRPILQALGFNPDDECDEDGNWKDGNQ